MATYYYKFKKEKKLSSTITQMANVTVINEKGKEIGNATVSKYESVEKVVDMLVRDYELSKVWSSKHFSFNQLTKN